MPWRAIEEAKTVSLYELFGYDLLVVCAVLALRVLVLIIHPRPVTRRENYVQKKFTG